MQGKDQDERPRGLQIPQLAAHHLVPNPGLPGLQQDEPQPIPVYAPPRLPQVSRDEFMQALHNPMHPGQPLMRLVPATSQTRFLMQVTHTVHHNWNQPAQPMVPMYDGRFHQAIPAAVAQRQQQQQQQMLEHQLQRQRMMQQQMQQQMQPVSVVRPVVKPQPPTSCVPGPCPPRSSYDLYSINDEEED